MLQCSRKKGWTQMFLFFGTDVLSPARDFSLSMDEGFDSDDASDRDSSDEGTVTSFVRLIVVNYVTVK